MRDCPACAFRLPDHARFCARCGQRLPGEPGARGRPVPGWLLVLFLVGIAATGLVALVYAAILVAPDLPAARSGVTPPQLRVGAALLSALSTALFLLQLLATIGLLRRRSWGRILATAACVAWALTCVGIPFSVLALTTLWRTPQGEAPTMVP